MNYKRAALLGMCILASGFGATTTVKGEDSEKVTITAAPIGRFGILSLAGLKFWQLNIDHLLVFRVAAGSPAEKAGMRAGDEILSVDGVSVPGRPRGEVYEALGNHDAGKAVVFRISSDKGRGMPRDVTIVPIDPHPSRH